MKPRQPTRQNRRRSLALAAILLMAVAPALVWAQFGPGGPGGPPHGGPGDGDFGPVHQGPKGGHGRSFGHGPGPGGPGHLPPHMLQNPKVAEKLGLEEAQIDQIKDLNYDTESESIAIEAKVRQAELNLRRELEEDNPDETKVMGLIEQVGTLNIKRTQLDMRRNLSVRRILTKEQQQKARELIQKHRAKRRERMGRGGRRFGHHDGRRGGPDGAEWRERRDRGRHGDKRGDKRVDKWPDVEHEADGGPTDHGPTADES